MVGMVGVSAAWFFSWFWYVVRCLFSAFSIAFRPAPCGAPSSMYPGLAKILGCGTAICKISRKLSPKNGACVFAATACSFLLPSDEWNTHWVALLPDLKVFCKFWSPPRPPPGAPPPRKSATHFFLGGSAPVRPSFPT